jgi:hypothetical protein
MHHCNAATGKALIENKSKRSSVACSQLGYLRFVLINEIIKKIKGKVIKK